MTPAVPSANMLLNVLNAYRYRRGVTLLKKTKTAIRGLRILGKAAQSGNLEAQYTLGLCYLRGENVPANRTSAIRWLLPAAAAGHMAAQCRLASLCLQGGVPVLYNTFSTTSIFSNSSQSATVNFVDALYWAGEAAARGSPEALSILGFIQSEGPEDFRDPAAARRSYEASAEAGFPKGSLGLAVLTLREGQLTPERGTLAKELLRKAEDGDEPLASYYLGRIAETENDIALALI